MPRLMLTDEMWSKLKAILLDDRVYNKQEHRFTMEGILGVFQGSWHSYTQIN